MSKILQLWFLDLLNNRDSSPLYQHIAFFLFLWHFTVFPSSISNFSFLFTLFQLSHLRQRPNVSGANSVSVWLLETNTHLSFHKALHSHRYFLQMLLEQSQIHWRWNLNNSSVCSLWHCHRILPVKPRVPIHSFPSPCSFLPQSLSTLIPSLPVAAQHKHTLLAQCWAPAPSRVHSGWQLLLLAFSSHHAQ